MNSPKKDLWLRIRDYHFENLVPPHLIDHVAEQFGGANASTRAFAHKVAKKTGWTLDFALRAIDEYKKFAFLGVTADFFVTPPKVIDRVWHEHILFTKGYREFCRTVLRHDFDHHPELVATGDQTAVFQAQYEATLERYEAEFNMAPPSPIWGTPKFKSPRPGKRKEAKPRDTASDSGDGFLYTYFESESSSSGGSDFFSGFGDGGGFGGAGAERSWGGESHSHDSGSDSGDSGGGDGGGGSGCSSGCGGGGCSS